MHVRHAGDAVSYSPLVTGINTRREVAWLSNTLSSQDDSQSLGGGPAQSSIALLAWHIWYTGMSAQNRQCLD